MKAYGLLMIEHRHIEKAMDALAAEHGRMKTEGKADTRLIAKITDFLRTYADAIHHGKEEDVLFDALSKKPMSDEHKGIMERLLSDHRTARKMVGSLISSCERYAAGDSGALDEMTTTTGDLLRLYASHIETEDKHFFIPTEEYFSQEELSGMLSRFMEFDKDFPKQKYERMAGSLSA